MSQSNQTPKKLLGIKHKHSQTKGHSAECPLFLPTESEPELINWSFSLRRTCSVGQSGSSHNPPSCLSCVCPRHFTLQRLSPTQARPRPAPLLQGGPPSGRHAYQWFTRDGGEGTRDWDEEVQREREREGRGGLASALRPGQQLESIKSVGLLLH